MSDLNDVKNVLWGEIRSCLSESKNYNLERLCEILANWPSPLHEELRLRAYLLAHLPDYRPNVIGPPPLDLALMWMNSEAKSLFALLFKESEQRFEQCSLCCMLRALTVFGNYDSGAVVDIELGPLNLDSMRRAWTWARQCGSFVNNPTQWCEIEGRDIELKEVEDIADRISLRKGGLLSAGFTGLTPPGDFVTLPCISLWFEDGYMELAWVGGLEWGGKEICSLLEAMWYISGENSKVIASIPMFDNGGYSGLLKEMWHSYVSFRQMWSHSA